MRGKFAAQHACDTAECERISLANRRARHSYYRKLLDHIPEADRAALYVACLTDSPDLFDALWIYGVDAEGMNAALITSNQSNPASLPCLPSRS